MKEEELQHVVEGTMRFFDRLPGTTTVSAPYPEQGDTPILGMSGAIGITGTRKGCIYITAEIDLLKDLCADYAGVVDADDAAIADMIGELANTIAGNAQEALGGDYKISVPLIITGRPDKLQLPLTNMIFVIPFQWKEHKAFLVIGME